MAEREVLSQIPEDRVCDFPVKARTGNGIPGLPAKLPTGLARQASGTAAALEEVSKCVREMHSFTSELLSWDLVERNGGNGNSAGNPGTAEADSSGDSDDTVIEEAAPEEAPAPLPPGATPVPSPIPAARDWEEERLTLRALQELGEPPREPPNPSGNVAEPPPPAGRPLLLWRSLAARELVLWRDPRRSALVLGASLVLLLSLATLSAVSVCAHLALALLCVTVSLRVYRALLQALHKAEEGHPFRAYLELDITLSPETFRAAAAAAAPPPEPGTAAAAAPLPGGGPGGFPQGNTDPPPGTPQIPLLPPLGTPKSLLPPPVGRVHVAADLHRSCLQWHHPPHPR
uniref:Reticulon n=1 Tax=Strigops habroptila TaxID=2489341 RepID=A0A672U529_STRHB